MDQFFEFVQARDLTLISIHLYMRIFCNFQAKPGISVLTIICLLSMLRLGKKRGG